MSDGGKDIKLFQLLVQVYSDSGKELKLQKDASSTGLKLNFYIHLRISEIE